MHHTLYSSPTQDPPRISPAEWDAAYVLLCGTHILAPLTLLPAGDEFSIASSVRIGALVSLCARDGGKILHARARRKNTWAMEHPTSVLPRIPRIRTSPKRRSK